MVFGGDLNTDLSRASPHTQALSEFGRNYQMGLCIEIDHANVPYIYISPNRDTSKVDHVIVSSNISDHIVLCNIIDSIHLDHVPIKTVIELEIPIRHFNLMFQIFMIHMWLGTVQRTSILMFTKSYFITSSLSWP